MLALCFADDNRTVTGVQIEIDGKKQVIQASREVILCAGAFGSPQLLELSGIGDAARLQKLRIKPKVNLPAVGENLADHFLTRLTFCYNEDSLNKSLSGFGFLKEIMRFALSRKGALTMPAGIVAGFVASRLADDNCPIFSFM